MAGLGRRTFAPGEVLTASNVMNYLQDQVVQNYAGTAARGSAIGSAVSQGMVSYLDDSNSLEVYKTTGTAVAGWEPVNMAQSPNVVINGGFDIWQRGTSFSNPSSASNVYTADRWVLGFANANPTSASITQQTFTPGTEPVSGNSGGFFARSTITTVGSTTVYRPFTTRIEDVRTLANSRVTFSFYAKSDSARTVNIYYSQNFGSGGSASFSSGLISFNLTTSWQRFSVTIDIPSISGKTIGSGSNLEFGFQQAAVSGSVFDLWGVQLEVGQTATPFRRNANSLQGELAACQRYFERSYNIGVAVGTNTNDGNISFRTTNTASAGLTIAQSWYFKVSKRGTPTVRTYGSYTGTIDRINVGTSDFSATVYGASQNGASAFVGGTIPANSDISWQWTAESEL